MSNTTKSICDKIETAKDLTHGLSTKREIKQEWCEAWIKHLFTKLTIEGRPIEGTRTGLFWELAEKAGLYEAGTYGSPMTKALEKLATVEAVKDKDGNTAYYIFKLKWAYT